MIVTRPLNGAYRDDIMLNLGIFSEALPLNIVLFVADLLCAAFSNDWGCPVNVFLAVGKQSFMDRPGGP